MENSAIDTAAAIESRASFTIDARQIAAAAAFIRKRIASKTSRYGGAVEIAAASVRVTARPCGTVTLEASRAGYVGAIVTLSAEHVAAPGAFVTAADVLDAAAQKASKAGKGALATIVDGPGRATLKAGRASFALVSRDASNPATLHPIPHAGSDATLSAEFALPLAQFAADVKALAPAIGDEYNRTELHQIAIQRRELAGRERLLFLATDGRNVAAASRDIPAGAESLADCGLPSEIVPALLDMAKLSDADSVALRIEDGPLGETFTLSAGNVVLAFGAAVEAMPDVLGAVAAVMGEPGEQAPLFPELLPGAPTGAMEKLAKGAPGAVAWEHSGQMMLGACEDPALFFAAMRCEPEATGRKGESYRGPAVERYKQPSLPGATGEIVGPDDVAYPVPFKDNGAAIGFTAAQVCALIGESCFETMEFPGADGQPRHVARWLWDDGASRLLIVKPDGRCPAEGEPREYVMRSEVEAALAGDVAPAQAQSVPEPAPIVGAEAVPQSDRAGSDATAAILARLDALEAALATLPAQSAATPSEAIAEPRAKRTPAHERAIRRAWRERQLGRGRREDADRHRAYFAEAGRRFERLKAICEGRRAQLRDAHAKADAARMRADGMADLAHSLEMKRRHATPRTRRMLAAARKRIAYLEADRAAIRERADSAAAVAREALAEAQSARQAQAVAEGTLSRLRTDLADASQPERASDIAQLVRERDAARNACAALERRALAAEGARDTLADAVESMASRMAVAEAAVRRLQAA